MGGGQRQQQAAVLRLAGVGTEDLVQAALDALLGVGQVARLRQLLVRQPLDDCLGHPAVAARHRDARDRPRRGRSLPQPSESRRFACRIRSYASRRFRPCRAITRSRIARESSPSASSAAISSATSARSSSVGAASLAPAIDDRRFAAHGRFRRQLSKDLRDGAALIPFVGLGQVARQARLPVAEDRQRIREGRDEPVGCFVEVECRGLMRVAGEQRAALAAGARRVAEEQERDWRDPGSRQRRHQRVRPRHARDRHARREPLPRRCGSRGR